MVKYSTALLFFAVAVFWSSASARSIDGSFEEPHHGISVENDADIEKFLKWGLNMAKNSEDSHERVALTKVLHEAKHKRWPSFEEFTEYLYPALRAAAKKTNDKDARRKRSAESNIDEIHSAEFQETFKDTTPEEKMALLYSWILVNVAPSTYHDALIEKMAEVVAMFLVKDYDNTKNLYVEAERIFKEVTGDYVGKYEDQIMSAIPDIEQIYRTYLLK